MKRSEELKLQLEELEKEHRAFRDKVKKESGLANDPNMRWWKQYYDNGGRSYTQREEDLKYEIIKEQNRELDVGDGCTVRLYSDKYACTVIKKTKCTITVQRDKATLVPDFKPEWVEGGFAGHCVNSEEQDYTYERDENGEKFVCYWSEVEGRYRTGNNGCLKVSTGRHEFYDYNF